MDETLFVSCHCWEIPEKFSLRRKDLLWLTVSVSLHAQLLRALVRQKVEGGRMRAELRLEVKCTPEIHTSNNPLPPTRPFLLCSSYSTDGFIH